MIRRSDCRWLPLMVGVVALVAASAARAQAPSYTLTAPPRADAERVFTDAGMRGCFVVHDVRADRTLRVNAARCARRLPPASTFKIPNALIGLETGVVTDEHMVIAWDGVERSITDWNRDLDLAAAIRVSSVPYFQELARRVGATRMRDWVRRFGYGNRDIRGGIDRFWLDGRLRISADEQVAFLRRVQDRTLPVSGRTIDILRRIITLEERADGAVLRAKTGWALRGNWNVGWFVGWIERGDDAWIFALNVEPVGKPPADFLAKRRLLAESLLRLHGVW